MDNKEIYTYIPKGGNSEVSYHDYIDMRDYVAGKIKDVLEGRINISQLYINKSKPWVDPIVKVYAYLKTRHSQLNELVGEDEELYEDFTKFNWMYFNFNSLVEKQYDSHNPNTPRLRYTS